MKADYFTNTVEGAEGFERYYNESNFDLDYNDDTDYYKLLHDQDDCNCSDPGCPCGGCKYGQL